jgi:hypothetical protein
MAMLNILLGSGESSAKRYLRPGGLSGGFSEPGNVLVSAVSMDLDFRQLSFDLCELVVG